MCRYIIEICYDKNMFEYKIHDKNTGITTSSEMLYSNVPIAINESILFILKSIQSDESVNIKYNYCNNDYTKVLGYEYINGLKRLSANEVTEEVIKSVTRKYSLKLREEFAEDVASGGVIER